MNWVINHLNSLFEMEYFTLPSCNAFIVNLQWQLFWLLCGSLTPIWITNNSKGSIVKTCLEQKGGKCGKALPLWWFSALSQKSSSRFWHNNLSLFTAAFSLKASKHAGIQCIVVQTRQISCFLLLGAFRICGMSMDDYLVTLRHCIKFLKNSTNSALFLF